MGLVADVTGSARLARLCRQAYGREGTERNSMTLARHLSCKAT